MSSGQFARPAVGLVALGVVFACAPEPKTVRAERLGTPVTWEAFTSPFISEARQLTSQEMGIRRAGEGYFSPDGKMMVFQAERDTTNPFFQIFTMDLATGDMRQISPGTGKTTCAFFRPGTDEIQYSSSHRDPEAVAKQVAEIEKRKSGAERYRAWDYDPQMDIFTSRRDGSGERALTSALGYDAEGAYSPDGARIVFSSTRGAYPLEKLGEEDRKRADEDVSYFAEIYLMDADGSNQTRLTDWPGYDGGPFFTPDGGRIVWRHFEPDGRVADVYTMKPDGTDRLQLTAMGAMSWAPYFHPSMQYAIFTTNVHGFRNFELYIVDSRGEKEPVRVTDSDGFDGLPVFTPDGEWLCWTAGRTPNHQGQLFMAKWNHEGALAALKAAPGRGQNAASK